METDDRHIYEYIGERIRFHRQKAKVTQATLAKQLGMLRSSLANIEAGRQRASLWVIYQFCKALDIEISAVLPTVNYVIPPIIPTPTREETSPKTQALLDRLLDETSE